MTTKHEKKRKEKKRNGMNKDKKNVLRREIKNWFSN